MMMMMMMTVSKNTMVIIIVIISKRRTRNGQTARRAGDGHRIDQCQSAGRRDGVRLHVIGHRADSGEEPLSVRAHDRAHDRPAGGGAGALESLECAVVADAESLKSSRNSMRDIRESTIRCDRDRQRAGIGGHGLPDGSQSTAGFA